MAHDTVTKIISTGPPDVMSENSPLFAATAAVRHSFPDAISDQDRPRSVSLFQDRGFLMPIASRQLMTLRGSCAYREVSVIAAK